MIIKMILLKSFPYLFLLCIPKSIVFAQTYTAYQTSVPYISSATACPSNQYFDVALLQCSLCPASSTQKSTDPTQCECNDGYFYGVNQGGGSLLCITCGTGFQRSSDGFGCIATPTPSCDSTTAFQVPAESAIDGSLISPSSGTTADQPRIGSESCITCLAGTSPDIDGQRCTPCASTTPRTSALTTSIVCCTAATTNDGMCLTYLTGTSTAAPGFIYTNRFTTATTSLFFQQHLIAAYYLCLMNLNSGTAQSTTRILLSNATACQVLANIAAMQFYYGATGYAYYIYNINIWNPPLTSPIWLVSSNRTSIPFLAYPSTYYSEISSSTYNWIPSSFTENDLIRLKLAKYSVTGQFLGLVDAFDTYIQLCGGGYTDGEAAFTFGTEYSRSCNIRADALWNSTTYETAFFDPYLVFTQSGQDYMLPTPIVITNYQSDTGSFPNQNSDESTWTYHRRFFLLDRISGITTGTTSSGVLQSIHYAQSIQILNTLTSGTTYIQPPVIVVTYGELTTSDIGTGTLIQVTFESHYRMNLDTQIRDIWIAVGVLSALGVLLAFAQTTAWQSRSGRDFIDLATIGKFFLYICNILATVFFIVMAGVSLWWLIFFKRQDAIYLVIPTSFQQQSFTALVCVAFALKTLDIFHLIIRQGSIDIFFMDWEKPKPGNANNVSVWRTYFVANEFNEIQAFRRISLTFQLFFVLFLLKVINLENVATTQPGVNLFPSSSDYVPGYNGILRVGIAFAMWIATALVQYLIYILFYQRFVEDTLLNFVDLCSVSNISVFMLTDTHYGYYLHGRSPHGTTDVNIRDMIMNLERESNQMSGTRGLQAKSDEQIFIMKLARPFRGQYNQLLQSYKNRAASRSKTHTNEKESEVLMEAYRNINEFLCAFINHSLPLYNYIIRERNFFEKLINYEFQSPNPGTTIGDEGSLFFVDSEKNFAKSIFAGHENSLFIWNMATFLFIDYFAFNYVLAAIVTYILNLIAIKMRLALGRRNLAAKTLVPKNFLI